MPPGHLLPPSKHSQDMGTLTLRLPNEQHERLKTLAARRGVSLNRLFEALSLRALTDGRAWTSGCVSDSGRRARRLLGQSSADSAFREPRLALAVDIASTITASVMSKI